MNESLNVTGPGRSGSMEGLLLNARYIVTMNSYVVLVLSTLLNSILLVVMRMEKNETLRAYSTVLRLNCVCDLAFTAVTFLIDTQADIIDGQIVCVLGGPFPALSRGWNYLGINAYFATLAMSVFIVPIIFYYRYCLIVKKSQLSVGRLLAATGIAFIAAVLIGAELVLAMAHDANTRTCAETLSHPLWTHGGYTVDNCLIVSETNWLLSVHLATISVCNFIVYPLMAYFTVSIFRALKEHESRFSQRTSRVQRQMNVLLIVQLGLPLLCGCVPISLIFTLTTFHYTIAGVCFLLLILLTWIPLINPLVTILLVSSYRRRCWLLLRGRRHASDWTTAGKFSGGGALSSKRNSAFTKSSRS